MVLPFIISVLQLQSKMEAMQAFILFIEYEPPLLHYVDDKKINHYLVYYLLLIFSVWPVVYTYYHPLMAKKYFWQNLT